MAEAWQQLLVGLIVLLAALYALWAFMPARWRQALARRAGLARAPGRACQACDDCAGCAPPSTADRKVK